MILLSLASIGAIGKCLLLCPDVAVQTREPLLAQSGYEPVRINVATGEAEAGFQPADRLQRPSPLRGQIGSGSFSADEPGPAPATIASEPLDASLDAGAPNDSPSASELALEASVAGLLGTPIEAAAMSDSAEPNSDPMEPFSSGNDKKLCSIDVSDLELSTILRTLSNQTGVNLVLMAKEAPKVTLRLSQVPLDVALRHLCAVTNLASLKVGDTFVVATADQLKASYPNEWAAANAPEPIKDPVVEMATDTYTCSYVNARQIADALTKIYTDAKLVVQVGPGQRVPEVSGNGANTGNSGGSSNSDTGAGANADGGRTLVFRGPKDVVESAVSLAKRLDSPRPQVSIAVKIHDISNDALKSLGVQWDFGSQTISESQGKGVNFGTFTRSPMSFSATISALEKSDKAKLLAEPNISVLDNERAYILIGQRLNFPVLVGYSQANTPIFSPKEERVGIYLQVSASVAENKDITLSLYPQVSTVSGYLETNGASYPQISTREAKTTLRVKNGETILMGGLIRDEEIAQIEKVPILSQIPLFGELFKRRKTTRSNSQVIISITPIVTNPGGK